MRLPNWFCYPILALALAAYAQDVPPAPIPTQLKIAARVFVSNAGELDNTTSSEAYNRFYAGLLKLNQLQPVSAPGDSDLILELRYLSETRPKSFYLSNTSTSRSVRICRVSILDTKTHVILWTLSEEEDKNLASTMARIIGDLDVLTKSGSAPISKK